MPLALPPELKKITPFIRRAEELDKDKTNAESRLVAYYCRQYAVHTGIALAVSSSGKTALGSILNDLEKEKVPMSSFTKDESKYLCRQFADKIFQKADQEDRSGNAGKSTAMTFYAAATFMEIVEQFYPDDDISEEREEAKKKVVYAKWKATDIIKAIKEGREPTPGGYVEQESDFVEGSGDVPAPPMDFTPAVPAPPSDFPPASPASAPSRLNEATDPIPIAPPDDDDDVMSVGTEVQLGPPPAYPGESSPLPDIGADQVFMPLPPPPMPAPRSAPKMAVSKPVAPVSLKKSSGIFGGFGKKKVDSSRYSKEVLADAMELANFAIAALQSKDGDLAATRLQQALEALGR